MNCPKCEKEMDSTPVCIHCGIIPVAESSFNQLKEHMNELLNSLKRLELAASAVALEDNSDSNPQAVELREALGMARLAIRLGKIKIERNII